MAQLILLRHGQSLWNASNRFTGWVDVPLSERGRAEATIASCKLRNYRVQVCFTSMLMRALETAVICLTECDEICEGKIPIIKHNADDPQWHGWDQYGGNVNDELPIIPSAALDERYYGNLRSIVMYLDHLAPEDIPELELKTGVPIVYEIDAKGEVQSKIILND